MALRKCEDGSGSSTSSGSSSSTRSGNSHLRQWQRHTAVDEYSRWSAEVNKLLKHRTHVSRVAPDASRQLAIGPRARATLAICHQTTKMCGQHHEGGCQRLRVRVLSFMRARDAYASRRMPTDNSAHTSVRLAFERATLPSTEGPIAARTAKVGFAVDDASLDQGSDRAPTSLDRLTTLAQRHTNARTGESQRSKEAARPGADDDDVRWRCGAARPVASIEWRAA